jgi:hypothetical protein
VFGEGPLPLSGIKPTVPPLARIDGADVVFGGNFGQGEYRCLRRPPPGGKPTHVGYMPGSGKPAG